MISNQMLQRSLAFTSELTFICRIQDFQLTIILDLFKKKNQIRKWFKNFVNR